MVDDMKGHWFGPMPVQRFLDEFMPPQNDEDETVPPFPPDIYFSAVPPPIPDDPRSRQVASETFVGLVEKYLSFPPMAIVFDIIPQDDMSEKVRFATTVNGSANGEGSSTPSVMMMSPNGDSMDVDEDFNLEIPLNELEEIIAEFRFGHPEPCDPFELHPLSDIDEGVVEYDPNIYPERSRAESIEDDAIGEEEHRYVRFGCNCTEKCRDAITARLAHWFSIQHRIHGFMLFVGYPWVRFIRADRCGAVFSERFDLRTSARHILTFYWRFAQIKNWEELGLDPTVRVATKDEVQLAQKHLPQIKVATKNNVEYGPVFVIKIPDERHGEGAFREVISCRPTDRADEPLFGRAPRAWPVYDIELKKVVFFKEVWRTISEEEVKESQTLLVLNRAGVRNVPMLLSGGDVEGDVFTTRTQEYINAEWNAIGSTSLLGRTLHRTEQDFVAGPLEKYTDTKQMLQAVYDAFVAHSDAYTKCRIIHCNINVNSILITAYGSGVLVDWDLAKSIRMFQNGITCHIGEWRYMSVRLLRDPLKSNDIQDDIESFIYVVIYTLLRYTQHNRADQVHTLLQAIFDQKLLLDGSPYGGDGKSTMIELLQGWQIIANEPMQQFVDLALNALMEWILQDAVMFDYISNSSLNRRSSHRIRGKGRPRPRLSDHEYLTSLLEEVLSKREWPKRDSGEDCFEKVPGNGLEM